MSQIVKFDSSVPAYLQRPELMRVAQQAVGGINSFSSPSRISIRAGRFHFVDTEGVESDSTEHNGVALDVIVLDANPNISKRFYEAAYNPAATEPVMPTCFSDNAVGPSERSSKPQSATCALCPHNVWGSKVTLTGSKVKACSDSKLVAVIPASNPTGPAYQLSIPAASLKPWQAIVALLTERGVPLGAMVLRLGFDTTVSFPKLTYNPVAWLSEAQMSAVADLIGSDETQAIVGATDKPIAGLPATGGQQDRAEPVVQEQPEVVRPVGQANPVPPIADLPTHTAAALAQPRRTRRTKEQIAADEAAAAGQQNADQRPAPVDGPVAIPDFLRVKTEQPATTAQPAVQPASADMDALLDGIMKKGAR